VGKGETDRGDSGHTPLDGPRDLLDGLRRRQRVRPARDAALRVLARVEAPQNSMASSASSHLGSSAARIIRWSSGDTT
jgi:hypothetical protein